MLRNVSAANKYLSDELLEKISSKPKIINIDSFTVGHSTSSAIIFYIVVNGKHTSRVVHRGQSLTRFYSPGANLIFTIRKLTGGMYSVEACRYKVLGNFEAESNIVTIQVI